MPVTPQTHWWGHWRTQTPHFLEGLKGVGTGNSAGLFAAGVALYYFANRDPRIIFAIKLAAFIYLAGVFLFALSLFAYVVSMTIDESDVPHQKARLSAWRVSLIATLIGYVGWWIATGIAVWIIANL